MMAREMKDSGIEWIGLIPINWEISKIKYELECKDDLREPISTEKRDRKNPQYDYYGASGIIDKIDYYNVDDEVLLIGEDGANLVMRNLPLVYKAKGKFWVNNHAHILKPFQHNNYDFLGYLLEAGDYTNYITGSAQPKLSQSNLMSFYILKIPIDEQEKIADFLDKKCAEIDALSSDVQSQIDILENYKKSVITEAVTKGLNSDVEMKDSGIEWIGEIPSYWGVDRIKYHFRRNEPRNPGNTIVLSVYREYGVIPKDSRDDNHNVTSEDTSKYKYVKKGNLVINKMKAWQGSLAVSQYEGIVSPAYFIYEFTDDRLHKKYFHYLIRGCYKDEFKRLSGGIREGQWDLSSSEFEKTLILIPPIEEQQKISNYLDKKCTEINDAIDTKKQQLDILEQYKKSLIYEYVTGKKEVE